MQAAAMEHLSILKMVLSLFINPPAGWQHLILYQRAARHLRLHMTFTYDGKGHDNGKKPNNSKRLDGKSNRVVRDTIRLKSTVLATLHTLIAVNGNAAGNGISGKGATEEGATEVGTAGKDNLYC
ncbi:hypothetical protein DFH27DRAFT_529240 [Peziza echinospora]|nr:hypothetical protein DFH27DRAFT_529240 [Peziza echinospora]